MISFSKKLTSDVQTIHNPKSENMSDELSVGTGATGGNERITNYGLTFDQMFSMYKANVWVRVCVDKIVDRISGLENVVKPVASGKNEKEKEKIKRDLELVNEVINVHSNNEDEDFFVVEKKTVRDILIYDAGAIELVNAEKHKGKEKQRFMEFYSVAGNTIKLDVDKKGRFKPKPYLQVDKETLTVQAKWNGDNFIYFVNNPIADKIYGISPLETLVQTVTAEINASKYNFDFFNNNATPRFAVMMNNLGLGQGSPSIKRFKKFWNDELRGKPHSPIIMGSEKGNIELKTMGLTNDEMQFQEYSLWLMMKIMVMYKLQPLVMGIMEKVSGNQDYIIQDNIFKTEAIKPITDLMSKRLNQRAIWASKGLDLKTVYTEYNLDLHDKKAMSEWHKNYAVMGVLTINDIRTKGLGLPEVPWGDVPYMQNNVAPFGQGPNGQAVPGDANAAINLQTASKAQIINYLMKDNIPIGWEDIESSVRFDIIEKMVKERESELSKSFIIPEKIISKGK